jgi:phosphoglycolate phosphatase-like HAD superfamily hydrolase
MTSEAGGQHEEGRATGGAIWLRPGLARPERLDTALFDIDGVLIDTQRSYRLAVMHGSERLVRAEGLEPPAPMVSQEDVAAFKLAGGFNSDWDLTRLLAALWTARLREWHDQPDAALPLTEWARRASEAARAGHGGVAWMLATFPATAIPDPDTARWAHDEFYWGAALAREHYGHEPRFAPDAPGLVHNEALLLDEALLPALAARGIIRFGLITGREGAEVGWAVRHISGAAGLPEGAPPDGWPWYESAHGRSPFATIVPATIAAKPDPRALMYAVRALGTRAGLFVGDTADDLDLVLRYERESRSADPSLPPILTVMIATDNAAATYRERGADIILEHIRDLAAALAMLPVT